MRKTDLSQLRDIQQNALSALLKTVKVIKNKKKSETLSQLRARGDMTIKCNVVDPRTKKDR